MLIGIRRSGRTEHSDATGAEIGKRIVGDDESIIVVVLDVSGIVNRMASLVVSIMLFSMRKSKTGPAISMPIRLRLLSGIPTLL